MDGSTARGGRRGRRERLKDILMMRLLLTWKCYDCKPIWPVLLLQRFQLCILSREAAHARHIDHQHNLEREKEEGNDERNRSKESRGRLLATGTCRSIRQLLTFPSIASNAAWPEPSPFATEKSVTLALLLIGCLSFLSCFAANREKIVLPRPSGIFVYRGGEWGEGGAEGVLQRGEDWLTGCWVTLLR